jgi:biopolymer transport protein ExbD
MDMTPMVDVAFLLLIFFMSTTQFKPPEVVAVRLPGSTAQVRVPETSTIIITINKEGRLFMSTERVNDTVEVPKDQLEEAIMRWRADYPTSVIIVKGDRDVSFGQVNDLMTKLADAKANRFNLMTDVKRKGEFGGKPEGGA